MTALRTSIIIFTLALITATAAQAGPPLTTDDAGTVDVGKVEVELNGSYTHDRETADGSITKTTTTDAEIKITTGIYKNLGVSLAIPYTFESREDVDGVDDTINGAGDMVLELKYGFGEWAGIQFAVKPTLILPTGKYCSGLSEGRWQPGVTLIATKEFKEGNYLLHANAGYEHHGYRVDPSLYRENIWSGSIAGEAKLMNGLAGVLDFRLATNPDKASRNLPVYALTGARYEISDYLDIDAGIKFGLTKPEDDITVLYGLVLKF